VTAAHLASSLVSADQAKTVVREKEYQVRVLSMRSIDSIAEDYVERAAALDPALATFAGIAGHDGELPDLSADGFAERAELDRSTLAALDAAEAPGLREQTARAAMQERLALAVERYDAWTRRPARRRPPRPGSAASCAASCCRWPGRRTPADRRSTPGRHGTSSTPPWTWRRPTPGAERRSPGCAPSRRRSAA